MGSINSLRGCDQEEQLAKRRRSACRSCWRRFCHGLDRSGLVEGGVGSAITYVVAVVADHSEEGRSCWRMGAFCGVGGEELLAVSWREGLGVDSGEWNVKIQNAGWEAWKNCFAKTWGWTSFLVGPMNQIAASFFNQTSYYLRLNKNTAATAKTNGL